MNAFVFTSCIKIIANLWHSWKKRQYCVWCWVREQAQYDKSYAGLSPGTRGNRRVKKAESTNIVWVCSCWSFFFRVWASLAYCMKDTGTDELIIALRRAFRHNVEFPSQLTLSGEWMDELYPQGYLCTPQLKLHRPRFVCCPAERLSQRYLYLLLRFPCLPTINHRLNMLNMLKRCKQFVD